MNSKLYNAMLAAANPSQVPDLSRFFKTGAGQYGEGDRFLGIKVPVTRSIVKTHWRRLAESSDPFTELEECISSEYHEIRLAALLAMVEIFAHAGRSSRRSAPQDDRGVAPKDDRGVAPKDDRGVAPKDDRGTALRDDCIRFYLSHTDFINNWDLVDLSCYPLLGEWLLPRQDRSILYGLARSGRTIWEQRIGIVSTMTFIRHGELQDTFAIADILLHHPHDLIHKAVGWLLREAGKRNQAALEEYLIGHCYSESLPRYLQMPRTMLRYAIERFPEPLRQQYLKGNR